MGQLKYREASRTPLSYIRSLVIAKTRATLKAAKEPFKIKERYRRG
jgi:hypothetical protein